MGIKNLNEQDMASTFVELSLLKTGLKPFYWILSLNEWPWI